MKRIEALPRRYPGLAQMTGSVLSTELDPELQALCVQTSNELGMEMGAVTLLLERVQLIRASNGLPPELAAARAVDRDLTFCQFVVHEADLFEVNDAAHDARVPQEMVERYGMASYLGAPVYIGGEVVGAMCACDSHPRSFTDADRALIRRKAAAASARLEVLALHPRDRARALHDRAVRPAFGELRNRLVPVLSNVQLVQVALEELAAVQRLTRHVAAGHDARQLELLSRADEMLADMRELLGDLANDADQVHRSVIALERVSLVSNRVCTLREALDAAVTLAHHRSKLVGGVRLVECELDATLRASSGVAVRSISAAMSGVVDALMAEGRHVGIEITTALDNDVAYVCVRAGIDQLALEDAAEQLRLLVGQGDPVRVGIRGAAIELAFATRPRV